MHAFLPYKENVDLTYDGKRLQWNKSFEDLKKVIANVVGMNGKWTSPGGNSKKLFDNKSNITITWHYGKQRTLLFQGKDGYVLKNFLINVCGTTPTNRLEFQSSPRQVYFNQGGSAKSASIEAITTPKAGDFIN